MLCSYIKLAKGYPWLYYFILAQVVFFVSLAQCEESKKLVRDDRAIRQFWDHCTATGFLQSDHPLKGQNPVGTYGDDCRYNKAGEKLVVLNFNCLLQEPRRTLGWIWHSPFPSRTDFSCEVVGIWFVSNSVSQWTPHFVAQVLTFAGSQCSLWGWAGLSQTTPWSEFIMFWLGAFGRLGLKQLKQTIF